MSKHRKLLILALLLVATGTTAYLLYRRATGAPEAARLLPEGDRLAYINLKPVRLFGDLSKSRPLDLESGYRDFVDQTGFQFERDLDEIAVSWRETNAVAGRDVESAAIFTGHFDSARLKSYLQKISVQSETYRGLTIYSSPNGDHTVQACVLDGSRVAATTISADAMHGMIDRLHRSSDGPWLLQTYYHKVPATSLAWIIDRIGANSSPPQLGGLTLSFLQNKVALGSLRYNGSLLFRADVFAVNEADARQVMDSANAFLAVYRSVGRVVGTKGGDTDVKAAVDSIHVEQKGNVAVFTATFSERFIKKIFSEAQPEALTAAPSPSPSPTSLPKVGDRYHKR